MSVKRISVKAKGTQCMICRKTLDMLSTTRQPPSGHFHISKNEIVAGYVCKHCEERTENMVIASSCSCIIKKTIAAKKVLLWRPDNVYTCWGKMRMEVCPAKMELVP